MLISKYKWNLTIRNTIVEPDIYLSLDYLIVVRIACPIYA